MKKIPESDYPAILGALLGLGATMVYWYLILTGQIAPTPASWVVFASAVTLSYGAYALSDIEKSFAGNAGNAIDILVSWGTLLCIIHMHDGHISFNTFETACLMASGMALLFWVLRKYVSWNQEKRNPSFSTFLILQAVLVVGYVPMIRALWLAKTNSDSFIMWGVSWVVAACFIPSAWKRRDRFGIVYAGRALICASIVLALMIRLR